MSASTETERTAEDTAETTVEDSAETAVQDDHDAAATLEHHDEVEEHRSGSLAGRLLGLLVALLVGIGLALWGAPKVAPHVPESIAKYLSPADADIRDEVAALRASIGAVEGATSSGLSGLTERIAAVESGQTSLSETLADAQAAVETAKSETEVLTQNVLTRVDEKTEVIDAAAAQATELGARLATVETGMSDLRSELDAMATALTDAKNGEVAAAEVAASLAQLRRRVDEIAGAAAGGAALVELETRIATLSSNLEATRAAAETAEEERLAEIAAAKAAAQEALEEAEVTRQTALAEAEAAQQAAAEQVATAQRAAAINAATEQLRGRLAAGTEFSGALAELQNVSGIAPPEALQQAASARYPTMEALAGGFSPVAQAALTADVTATEEDGSTFGRVTGFLRSQVVFRPTGEVAGDDVPAVLSRVAARLDEGAAAAALVEAESLPDHAKSAMGDWLTGLRGRVAADQALDGYLDAIGVDG
ncbi:MAG: mitofilin family membrane protein [Pseudomonadota bacterium]